MGESRAVRSLSVAERGVLNAMLMLTWSPTELEFSSSDELAIGFEWGYADGLRNYFITK